MINKKNVRVMITINKDLLDKVKSQYGEYGLSVSQIITNILIEKIGQSNR